VGDSLEFSRAAARLDSEVIIFCGVDFMVEALQTLEPRVNAPEEIATQGRKVIERMLQVLV
jgi:quinolinate synthase